MKPLLFAAILASQAAGREIQLPDIYSTVRQDGLQFISSGRRVVDDKIVEEDYAPAMAQLRRGGASNIILVDAANISEAVQRTADAITGHLSADRPARRGVATGNNWLAAYLGCGHSQPLKWTIENLAVDGQTIRLTYRKAKLRVNGMYRPVTADLVFYYYFVPVGMLDDGRYQLELYDAELKEVTLMRRVEVKRR